jgi:CelD/BcsL family acetyltransferase involved in cellulose biosynthesis
VRKEINTADSELFVLDPLTDPRWVRLVERHPRATVFHSAGWLRALSRTYGYAPVAFTPARPDEAPEDALLFCRVESRLTGRRLVSLPFSDHCDPLVADPARLEPLLRALARREEISRTDYSALRPLSPEFHRGLETSGWVAAERYLYHEIDLRPGPEAVFRALHKSSVQRKIRRAEREGLEYREGNSADAIDAFYALHLPSRRFQGAPPQPRAWFHNLAACLGDAFRVRLALQRGRPVAAVVTLAAGRRMIYKYGASDPRFNALGGMPFLFWKTIRDGCDGGFEVLDLGRSDLDNPGLILFKNRLGARSRELMYFRRPPGARRTKGLRRPPVALVRRLPLPVLELLGKWLYRHGG